MNHTLVAELLMGFNNGGLDEMLWWLILKKWAHYGENKNTSCGRAKYLIFCSLNLLVGVVVW